MMEMMMMMMMKMFERDERQCTARHNIKSQFALTERVH